MKRHKDGFKTFPSRLHYELDLITKFSRMFIFSHYFQCLSWSVRGVFLKVFCFLCFFFFNSVVCFEQFWKAVALVSFIGLKFLTDF